MVSVRILDTEPCAVDHGVAVLSHGIHVIERVVKCVSDCLGSLNKFGASTLFALNPFHLFPIGIPLSEANSNAIFAPSKRAIALE